MPAQCCRFEKKIFRSTEFAMSRKSCEAEPAFIIYPESCHRRTRRLLLDGPLRAASSRGPAGREYPDDGDRHFEEHRRGLCNHRGSRRLTARMSGADRQASAKAANNAKAGCPVSKVLKAQIMMDVKLEV
jgi:hypothetical protein